MGCDIHGYIEYKYDEERYWGFGEGFGNRDYVMFGILADVRRDGCVYPPKGIPENMAFQTKWDYCLFVTDGDSDSDGCTSRANAENWVANGYSKWMDDEHTQISHPDWHTPSWLSVDEFETVVNKRKKHEWEMSPEWDAILSAMKSLPESRFVFWFDN
jgi:hypothetical protein